MKWCLPIGFLAFAVLVIAGGDPRSAVPASTRSTPVVRSESRPSAPRMRDSQAGELPAAVAGLSPQDWGLESKRARSLPPLLRWAAAEPEACLTWLQELPQELSSSLCTEIAGSLMAENPELAVQFIDELPPGPLIDEMLRQAAMELATRSPDRALDWATRQPDEANRDLLLSAVHLVMAATDPRRAAAETEAITNRPLRFKVLVEICQRWAQQDLATAADFVRSLPKEAAVPAAIQIASSWPDKDLANGVSWVGGLPEAGRDEVMRTLLSRPSLRDPATLDRLIQSTTAPELVALIRRQATPP